jgi:hypothetical protein
MSKDKNKFIIKNSNKNKINVKSLNLYFTLSQLVNKHIGISSVVKEISNPEIKSKPTMYFILIK